MLERYSLPRMRAIWSEENKLHLWLRIECLVVEALKSTRVISKSDFARIKRGIDSCAADLPGLIARQCELERAVHYDVVAFTTAVAERIDHKSSRWLHFGLTSSDVVDTALAVQLAQATDALIASCSCLLPVIARRAMEHMLTPCIGRSHGIHAEPITFGLKVALMHEEFRRAHERLKVVRQRISIGKLSGAVGTYAHLPPKIESFVCKRLGLRPAPIATQVIQRDLHAEFHATLALVSASVKRWAVEFRHLQRTEVFEVEEIFSAGQKGSSAMPHKRNPVTWERLTGLARVIRGHAGVALENVALWHERDISHSSVERIILPTSCMLLHYMLSLLRRLMTYLVVHPLSMERNLESSLGLWNSQSILLALIKKGVNREMAYHLVQRNAAKVWEAKGTSNDGTQFIDVLKADADIVDLFKSGELDQLCSLEPHIRHVKHIFKKLGLYNRHYGRLGNKRKMRST